MNIWDWLSYQGLRYVEWIMNPDLWSLRNHSKLRPIGTLLPARYGLMLKRK